jgi:hypothetical protein
MARSRKHTAISGITCATTEKCAKQQNHRRERRRVRSVLARQPECDVLPHTRELSDPRTMPKDGKRYWAAAGLRENRK